MFLSFFLGSKVEKHLTINKAFDIQSLLQGIEVLAQIITQYR